MTMHIPVSHIILIVVLSLSLGYSVIKEIQETGKPEKFSLIAWLLLISLLLIGDLV